MSRAARHALDAGSDFALTFSLHPLNLLQLWSPYFFEGGAYGGESHTFHEYGIYSGAILMVSCIWVWIRRDALAHGAGWSRRQRSLPQSAWSWRWGATAGSRW